MMKKFLSPDQFLVALVLAWKIWEIRNKEVHGLNDGFPPDLVEWSREYLRTYQEAQGSGMGLQLQQSPQSWIPPIDGFIKINVDAALPTGKDFYRISLVARNAQGECLWWSRRELVGRQLPQDAEAAAVFHGVRLAVSRRGGRSLLNQIVYPFTVISVRPLALLYLMAYCLMPV